MRRRSALLVAAALALALAGAPQAGASRGASASRPAPADSGFPQVGGAISADRGSSWLRGLRQLEDGSLPAGTVLVGEEVPIPPASGVSVSLYTIDVDADGNDELVQVRGTATKPKLMVTDGATGLALWERSMPSIYFSPRVVPDGSAEDVLLFDTGMVRRLDGQNGSLLWQKPLPGGAVGYWGVSQTPDGGDIVIGAWTDPDPLTGESGLSLEFRSLANGTTRGTLSLTGQVTFPTAALAGDLDGDGIGDLFTLSPLYLFGPASGGLLDAYTGRGATRAWRTAFAAPKTDESFLVAGVDATGDGRRDPVLVSEWLGAFGVDRALTTVSIVGGSGGDTAGLVPVAQVDLNGYPATFTTPGDVNGDGGQDVVFSGAVWYQASSEESVLFEAVGRNGIIWQGGPRYPIDFAEMGAGWFEDAGDLDGDGVRDALVLLGNAEGPDFSAGVSLRGGSSLWTNTPTEGRFTIPAYGDLDGDGGDDVLDDIWERHPETTQTSFTFTAASGDDLSPLWSDLRTADSGANGWSIYAIGGNFDDSGNEDVLAEYVMAGPGRHLAKAFQGASGETIWSSP